MLYSVYNTDDGALYLHENKNRTGVFMIVTTVSDCRRYCGILPALDRAFGWLVTADLMSVPEGKTVIDDGTVYCVKSSYMTKDPDDTGWEAHRKYIDVQLILAGSEMMENAPLSDMEEKTPYDSAKDFHALEGAAAQRIRLGPGHIAVFFPEFANLPCIQGECKSRGSVEKLVVKVAV